MIVNEIVLNFGWLLEIINHVKKELVNSVFDSLILCLVLMNKKDVLQVLSKVIENLIKLFKKPKKQ